MSREAVLIHGWDQNFYNKKLKNLKEDSVAWSHRSELLSLLSKNFDLKYFNLPGFCGIAEPKAKPYRVEDFADYFADWVKNNTTKPEVIIGYSFGGAVALAYKAKYTNPTPMVLISPAIVRAESAKSILGRKAKKLVPNFCTNLFKDIYQKVASKYYRKGTPFLRSTYNQIVRQDLRSLISQIKPRETLLIYGENDKATPWELVKDEILRMGLNYRLISHGRHDIGQTHPVQINEAIMNFLGK